MLPTLKKSDNLSQQKRVLLRKIAKENKLLKEKNFTLQISGNFLIAFYLFRRCYIIALIFELVLFSMSICRDTGSYQSGRENFSLNIKTLC